MGSSHWCARQQACVSVSVPFFHTLFSRSSDESEVHAIKSNAMFVATVSDTKWKTNCLCFSPFISIQHVESNVCCFRIFVSVFIVLSLPLSVGVVKINGHLSPPCSLSLNKTMSYRWQILGIRRGLFQEEKDAAMAYDRALVRLRGQTAATNFQLSDYQLELADYQSMQIRIQQNDPRWAQIASSPSEFDKWVKYGSQQHPWVSVTPEEAAVISQNLEMAQAGLDFAGNPEGQGNYQIHDDSFLIDVGS